MMHLLITEPARVMADHADVVSVRAEDPSGSFGILTGHADLITVLSPSVVSWRHADGDAGLRGGKRSAGRGDGPRPRQPAGHADRLAGERTPGAVGGDHRRAGGARRSDPTSVAPRAAMIGPNGGVLSLRVAAGRRGDPSWMERTAAGGLATTGRRRVSP